MRYARTLAAATLLIVMAAAPALADFEAPSEPPRMDTQTKAPRPWDFSIRMFGGYHDNVQLIGHRDPWWNGDTSSCYGGLQVDGAYRLIQTPKFTLGTAIAADQIWYADKQGHRSEDNSDANDYNLTTLSPALFAEYRLRVLDRPAAVGMSYTFRKECMNEIGAGGLQAHTLKWYYQMELIRHLTAGVSYAIGYDNFDVSFPENDLDGRDGCRQAFGVNTKYSWDQRKRSIALTYECATNNADGRNFDYDAHRLGARFESHLWGPLWLAMQFNYSCGQYKGSTQEWIPQGRKHMWVATYKVHLQWVINQNWSADVFWEYMNYDSNSDTFQASSNNIGFGLTLRL